MGCWLGLRALKTLYFYFCKVIKNKKINWKDFCKEFCKKLWKKNHTWNIRRLVNETIVPSTPQPFNPVYCIEDCQILGLKDQSDIPILNGLYCKACSSNHQQIFHTTPFVSYIKNKSNDILHHCQGVRQCQWHKDFTKASVIMARE